MRAAARERETTGTGRAAEFAKDCTSREPASERSLNKKKKKRKEQNKKMNTKTNSLSPLAKQFL